MPVGEYMFSSLKSNKNIMLDKTKRFKNTLGGYSELDKNEFDFPEVTPEILVHIKEKLKRERIKLFRRRITLFLIAIVLIILILSI